MAAAACAAWAGGVTAQTATWTGNSSNLWSGTANWAGTAPTNGSTLAYIFGAPGAINTSNSNDLTGLTASSITFNGNGTYTLGGNGLTLGGTVTNTAGGNTINLPLVLAATRTFDVTGGTLTVNGVLSGAGGVTKSGANTLGLFGSNSYTGVTTINGGFVQVHGLANGGINSSLGASSAAAANLVLNGGTLVKDAVGSGTTDRLFTLSEGGGTLYALGAPLNFTNTGSITATTGNDGNTRRTLTLGSAVTGVSTFSPLIPNGPGQRTVDLIKTGSGTWVLTNANTYSGGTTVSGGTLLLNNTAGSGTGTGAVTVASTGTLGGTGTVGGPLTVSGGGTLRAGSVENPTGTLTLTTGATFATSSTIGVRITTAGGGDATGTGQSTFTGGVHNKIAVTGGAVTGLGQTSLIVDVTGATFNYGVQQSYQIMTGAGDQSALSITDPSRFTFVGLTGGDTFDVFSVSLRGDAGGNVFLNFTPVPEPATVLGLAAAALGVGGLVRRRYRRAAAPAAV